MLFNSPSFLFVFLPIVLLGTFALRRFCASRLVILWLAASSLTFYCWDRPGRLLVIIGLSIAFNYAVSRRIAATRRPAWLWLGVAGNLIWLGVFKYAVFVAANLVAIGVPLPAFRISLPIGISFYTFTQIAFLVDAYRGETKPYKAIDYTLFVTFFPHLVAGPIIHHRDIMPQLARPQRPWINATDLAAGFSWFAAGMFKKVVLADGIAPIADATFTAAARGEALSGVTAWLGAVAYSLQLYFDFSGYSDMAIGLALMFGVRFPLNFLSPYKATSLADFWRRWHITLSRFLRDYLYIPLGGNRHGRFRRYLNLFITMLLGGIWHGAGWNFLVWGCLHGAGLSINQAWRDVAGRRGIRLPAFIGQALTLLLVVLAWVPFRADTLSIAAHIWSAMLAPAAGSAPWSSLTWVGALAAIALLAPNTAEIFGWADRTRAPLWRPTMGAAVTLGICLGLGVSGAFSTPTAFLYFRF